MNDRKKEPLSKAAITKVLKYSLQGCQTNRRFDHSDKKSCSLLPACSHKQQFSSKEANQSGAIYPSNSLFGLRCRKSLPRIELQLCVARLQSLTSGTCDPLNEGLAYPVANAQVVAEIICFGLSTDQRCAVTSVVQAQFETRPTKKETHMGQKRSSNRFVI